MKSLFIPLSILLFPVLGLSEKVVTISVPSDFQAKVNQTNTIYELRCVVDLKNTVVTIPNSSVLRFMGGSLLNGTIVGDNTMLDNPSNMPIFDNIYIADKPYQFINESICVDWFEGNDDSDKTQRAVDFAKRNRNAISFLSRQYTFGHTVVVPLGNILLKGAGSGGEYRNLGTKIIAAEDFSSDYKGSPLFYVTGEPKNDKQSLGLFSGHITGISFSTNRKNDVFQFLLSGAPSRPLFIDYCSFLNCNAAIRLLDNGKSTELGFLYVEHCTMKGNRWNVVAQGRHTLLGLYFSKNVAEQCDGNINLGYTENYSSPPFANYTPRTQNYAASATIVICDNLLEGTVDCIYVNGGKCVVDIERNYFETSRRQFVVLSFSNPNSTVTFQNNYIASKDDVYLYLRNCKYSVQESFSSSLLKTSSATPM